MAKNEKKGLGRGLGALFGEDIDIARTKKNRVSRDPDETAKADALPAETKDVSRETSLIRLSLIEPNTSQPRKVFDEESLKELTESIKEHGVLQPILVQKNGNAYEILVGERRWRAARMAGLKEIPAIVKEVGKQEAAEIALIENIQREDLNSVEEARAYRSLLEEFGLTQEELASRVSKSRTAITNSLRLLQLDKDVLDLVENGDLSAGHARAILSINGKRAQYKAAREVINSRLSVRETEKLAKQYNSPRKGAKEKTPDIYMDSLAEELTGALSARVSIRQKTKEKGRIEIEYYSLEELENLVDRLRG
ncbi:MAG: ParB/RepB/Spo0J family partition protein [Lachnospiraceae bacterium]|nr:ParB/RepB/Spo0J family partition protein [Lachnospiraceae bacterium]